MTDEKLSVIKTVSGLPPKSIGYGISAAIFRSGDVKKYRFQMFSGACDAPSSISGTKACGCELRAQRKIDVVQID